MNVELHQRLFREYYENARGTVNLARRQIFFEMWIYGPNTVCRRKENVFDYVIKFENRSISLKIFYKGLRELSEEVLRLIEKAGLEKRAELVVATLTEEEILVMGYINPVTGGLRVITNSVTLKNCRWGANEETGELKLYARPN